ncbi:MAG TPA: diguanylate cyclase, partial [Longimicrobiales bacterium]|nr:diguanylate cyclase [Longimicrobiales bacterium]
MELPSIVDAGPGSARVVQPGELEAEHAARLERERRPARTQFGRGLRTGLASARVGVGEAIETAAELTDHPKLLRLGRTLSEQGRARQALNVGRVTRIEDVQNLRDFGAWAAYSLGQGLGSTAAPVAGGVIGGVVAGPPGAAAGALGPSYALMLGEIRGELESAGVDPETIARIAPAVAVPAAGLEMLLPAAVGHGATRSVAARFGRELARRVAARAAVGALIEGATEVGQTAITRGTTAALSPDVEFLTEETLSELVNSALAGALPGAAFGAASGSIEGRLRPPRSPREVLRVAGQEAELRARAARREARRLPGDRSFAAPREEPAPAPAAGQPRRGLRRRIAEIVDPSVRRELDEGFTDPMTGLANQTAFERARPRLDADPNVEVIALDARNLKGLNDVLGREAGDSFIAEIGRVAREVAAERGVEVRNVFRAGGDEIAIAAPRGLGDEIGREIQRRVGARPIEGTELEAGVRYGVGDTWLDADAAAQASKASETGPRARTIPRTSQEAPAASEVTGRQLGTPPRRPRSRAPGEEPEGLEVGERPGPLEEFDEEGAIEEAARRLTAPITRQQVADFAVNKRVTVDEAAERLREAGFDVPGELVEAARPLAESMREQEARLADVGAQERALRELIGPEGETIEFTPEAIERRRREARGEAERRRQRGSTSPARRKQGTIEPFDEDRVQASGAPPESPLGGAEALDAEVTIAGEQRTLRPIAPVELVRLARELLGGSRLFVRRFPKARGLFQADPKSPRIGLHPELGRDYEQFARTLAHEIGHLVDFLEDRTLARGNILGRIASLRQYLQETLTRLPTDRNRALTSADRSRLRRSAEKQAGPRPTGGQELEDWKARVRETYGGLVRDEMEARHMLGRERVHEELMLLSEWWRPYDPETASESYRKYRARSTELYADALSVLLNSPGSLQARAPQFFEAWLAYLDEKPSVRQAYEEVQRLLAAGEGELYAARKAELKADFARGEAIQREAEQRREPQGIVGYLKQLLVTRAAPVTDAERRQLRALGRDVPAHSAEHAVKMALQEFNHGDNVNRVMLMDINRDVHQPLTEAGISPETAGAYLMLHRIAEGDRGGIAEQAKAAIMELTGQKEWAAARAAYIEAGKAAGETAPDFEYDPTLLELAETGVLNPHGYTPVEARRQLEGMRAELGPEAFEVLERATARLREIVFRSVEEAVRVGSYSRELFDTRIKPNRDTYAPFAVLGYFTGRVSAGIKRQVGTVSGIANPYTVAILKAMTLNRLNERQKAVRAILDVLDRDFPGQGEEQRVDRFRREKHPGPGKANLTYLVDGKLHYREVDQYIARVLERSDLGATTRFWKTLSSRTYGLFHPLYVAWSLGWQARNITRDWKRTFKNLAAAHAGRPTYRQAVEAVLDLGRLTRAYAQTAGIAWRNARRRDDRVIRQMLDDRALGRAFHSFEPVDSDLTHERLLQRYGIVAPETGGLRKVLGPLGRGIETMGIFQETWSKAAAFKLLGERGIGGRERAYIVRNYVGTPDATDRGLASDAT